jgi:hypothetical protein
MRNIIRLLTFSVVWFIVIFALSSAFSFLQLRISAAIALPVQRTISLKEITARLEWAISLAFYVSLLLSINYALQKKVNYFATLVLSCTVICALCFAVSTGFNRVNRMNAPPFLSATAELGSAGLILHQGDMAIALLDNPSVRDAPRVVSIPNRPLIYQEKPLDERGEIIKLPSAPFVQDSNWLFQNFYTDFSLSARQFTVRAAQGAVPFTLWTLPLALLLTALSFVFDIGVWPLAKLLLSAVFFRLVLWFEVFINSADTQGFLQVLFKQALPDYLINPFVLMLLTFLVLIYVMGMFFARGKLKNAKT